MRLAPFVALVLLAGPLTAMAAQPGQVPEITRAAAAPQAVGAAHTLRQVPEACARLEGQFTGVASEPYRFAVVRTSPNCQPRARFVDAAKAKPSEATGWKLNDLISVPSTECPAQHAVLRVWRKPANVVVPRDGQGQSRIYLDEARKPAAQGKPTAAPMFAAVLAVEGKACAK